MASQKQPERALLETTHSYFMRSAPNPADPPIAMLLRGVNLAGVSKFPSFSSPGTQPGNDMYRSRGQRDEKRRFDAGEQSKITEEQGRLWSEAEDGGRDGWFVGHPLDEDLADVHLQRLKAWGFTTIRYLVPWEALEHAGPGKYDEAYIDYTIRILRKCRAHGLRVFISPHQDVFSRFISGSGAPYWILEAFGLNPKRIHQTGAGLIHACWEKQGWGGVGGAREAAEGKLGEFPDMIWNTNLYRLAARHCFTMFFASETFAPKCIIDNKPAGVWARDLYDAAYSHLAERLRDAGDILDDCLIGWDSMNEPDGGFIGMPDIGEFPPDQDSKKGPTPTPIQAFRLGNGQPVKGVSMDDFSSLGHKSKGTVDMTPPGGKAVWLTREEAREAEKRWGYKWGSGWDFWNEYGAGGCVWAGHGLWNETDGSILRADYFNPKEGPKEFMQDFWKAQFASFIDKIRKFHPNMISFINPPIFGSPPDLSEETTQGRMALSSHFYDGLTMLGKRRHIFNADAVGIQRGIKSMLSAIKVGPSSIKTGFRDQLAELKSDAYKQEGMASDQTGKKEYPTIIGEIGVPFDMKKTKLLGLAQGQEDRTDYKQPTKLLNAADGPNALSYTIWCYEPLSTHKDGDGWNGEDLSLFSYDDIPSDLDLTADNPPDLKSLIMLGSRGIEGWCRPYPVEVQGIIQDFSFDRDTTTFELRIKVPSLEGSRLWAKEREDRGIMGQEVEGEGSALVYVPFVHYRGATPSGVNKDSRERLIGRPTDQGEEWEKGSGVAVLDLKLEEVSEGRLEAAGQYLKWSWDLRKKGDREVYLKFRRWP